jgi:hypothetical protein
MKEILIAFICFLLTVPVTGQDETDLLIAENYKKSMAYLMDKSIPVRIIDKIPNAILGWDCDSNVVAKQILPVGFCYWTVEAERYYSVENFEKYKVMERIKDKLGSTYVISGVNYQGNITVSVLSAKYFVIRGDSLFERIVLDNLSQDSVNMFTNEKYAIKKGITEIMTNLDSLTNSQYVYERLIFSPSKFIAESLVFKDVVTKDSIELQGLWEIEGKKYYDIRIKKPVDNEYSNYTLRFDDKFRFIDFEGDCDLTNLLTEETNQLVLHRKK